MKEKSVISLDMSSSDLVHFSGKYVLTKDLLLDVPRGYIAAIYIADRLVLKSKACVEWPIYLNVGKENLNKTVQVAFYKNEILTDIRFGFGQLNIKNDRLKEAYRVGVNGIISLVIDSQIDLINFFTGNDVITETMVRDKILPIIKSIGSSVVASKFANTEISVFEIYKESNAIRDEMQKLLNKEEIFERLGAIISTIAINNIYVDPDDIELIRKRINE